MSDDHMFLGTTAVPQHARRPVGAGGPTFGQRYSERLTQRLYRVTGLVIFALALIPAMLAALRHEAASSFAFVIDGLLAPAITGGIFAIPLTFLIAFALAVSDSLRSARLTSPPNT